MIVYTCPKCGGELQFSVITTYPPINVAECPSCGWRKEERDKIERIPYKTATLASDEDVLDKIEADIKTLFKWYPFTKGGAYIRKDDVKNIINKYKSEGEDKE